MESSGSEDAALAKWQRKLLPFMVRMVAGLTIFFFLASLVQLFYLHSRIHRPPEPDQNPVVAQVSKPGPEAGESEKLDYMCAVLEGSALQRRYHEASILLMANIWTRYLGFVTGMILALVGAAFVLGKLREPTTELNLGVERAGLGGSLKTASPGLVLAFLGTALMVTTLFAQHKVEIRDNPIWLSASAETRDQALVQTLADLLKTGRSEPKKPAGPPEEGADRQGTQLLKEMRDALADPEQSLEGTDD